MLIMWELCGKVRFTKKFQLFLTPSVSLRLLLLILPAGNLNKITAVGKKLDLYCFRTIGQKF